MDSLVARRATVLVVEDEPLINQAVGDRLRAEGHDVVSAYDGPGAVAAYEEHQPDLVVLDVMLPGFDGLEVCRRIQQQPAGAGADADRARRRVRHAGRARRGRRRLPDQAVPDAGAGGPGLGAAAPGGAGRAAGPRVGRRTAGDRQVGGLRLDPGARRDLAATRTEVHLTPTEFDLLCALAAAPGQVLTRERLLAEVWGWDGGAGATRTVDSHVKALRAKIGAERVRTVHGVGYALEER